MAMASSLEQLKAKAKAAGLWNMFLPDGELGAGLSVQNTHILPNSQTQLTCADRF